MSLMRLVDRKLFNIRDKKCVHNWFVATLMFLAMYSSIVLVWVKQSTVYYMPKSGTFKYNNPSRLKISYHNGVYNWDARDLLENKWDTTDFKIMSFGALNIQVSIGN